MIVDESDRGTELDLASFLDPGQFSNGLGDTSFLKNAEPLPEDEDRVHAFLHFLLRLKREAEVTMSQTLRMEHQSFSRMK